MTKAVQTSYTCPVCESKKHKLMIIMEPLDYGDAEVFLKPLEGIGIGIWFEFDIRESNFYYCKNCKVRFSRIDPAKLSKFKDKRIPRIFSDCILQECRERFGGRIGTYRDVVIGEIYIKGDDPKMAKRRKRVKELLEKTDMEKMPDVVDNFLQEFTGEFSLDQAGICNECGIVVAKEVDMK